jgi:hypothetical protein
MNLLHALLIFYVACFQYIATMDSKSKENCDENTKDDLKIIDTCCPAVEDTSNKSYEDKPGNIISFLCFLLE